MRAFLITTLCVSLAYAKPQYSYPTPSQQPSGSYGTPSVGGVSFGVSSGSSGVSNFFGNTAIPKSQTGGAAAAGGFTGSFDSGFGGGGGLVAGGGTLVQKHIYVHVAPPEPEEVRPQRPISAGQATKHYKIIFIKAPSYQSYQQQILQAQAQNEEKTLVYVLVKKPDEVADITLPTAAPTAPSKPEVYFIRYKAKSEVTGGGVNHLTGGGVGIGAGSITAVSGSSASSGQVNLNIGDSSSSLTVGRPSTNYGPPGQSGPY